MQDGKLDVTIIRPFTPFDIGPLAVQLFTKLIDRNSNIKTFETESISIIREKPGIMHIDDNDGCPYRCELYSGWIESPCS